MTSNLKAALERLAKENERLEQTLHVDIQRYALVLDFAQMTYWESLVERRAERAEASLIGEYVRAGVKP